MLLETFPDWATRLADSMWCRDVFLNAEKESTEKSARIIAKVQKSLVEHRQARQQRSVKVSVHLPWSGPAPE